MVISRRFCGPPDVANGGYACGRLARSLGLTAATVVLRRPLPVDEELDVRRTPLGGGVWRGAELLAQAGPATTDVAVPLRITLEEAAASTLTRTEVEREGLGGLTCFVCGADSEDGLRLLPGPLPGVPAVGTAWTPRDRTLSEDGSTVCPEVVWAALDCPGAWIDPVRGTRAVLARFRVKQLMPIRLDQRYAVVAELTRASTRGFQATSAVLARDGKGLRPPWRSGSIHGPCRRRAQMGATCEPRRGEGGVTCAPVSRIRRHGSAAVTRRDDPATGPQLGREAHSIRAADDSGASQPSGPLARQRHWFAERSS